MKKLFYVLLYILCINIAYSAPIHSAAAEGDVAAIKKLLTSGTNIDAKDHRSQTALIWAADKNQPAVVKFLLNHGADINAKNDIGETALIKAARRDYYITKILLERGADVNAKDNSGNTALIWAAGAGKTDIVNLLLDRGAKVNEKNNIGETAFNRAAERGYTDICNLLAKKGAKDKNFVTLIMVQTRMIIEGISSLAWGIIFEVPFLILIPLFYLIRFLIKKRARKGKI